MQGKKGKGGEGAARGSGSSGHWAAAKPLRSAHALLYAQRRAGQRGAHRRLELGARGRSRGKGAARGRRGGAGGAGAGSGSAALQTQRRAGKGKEALH